MSDRESLFRLRDLRAHAEDQHRPNPVMVTMTTAEALALLDVAERARWLQTCFREHLRTDVAGFDLDQALARFDFGDASQGFRVNDGLEI